MGVPGRYLYDKVSEYPWILKTMRNKKMKKRCRQDNGSRGSLTVEALLFLIPFMMAFFTLINAARFVQAEMLIHHAITQTAKQISAYGYVLTKAEISSRMQETNRKSDEFKVTVDQAASSIEGFTEAVGDMDALADGVLSRVKNLGQQAVMTYVVGMLSENNIKNAISLVSDDPDEYLENIGIVGGLSGLQFSDSEMISNTGGKADIKIVVTYTMKNILFPDFDFGQYEFCQCAYTLMW